jgi:hypothetical protein
VTEDTIKKQKFSTVLLGSLARLVAPLL